MFALDYIARAFRFFYSERKVSNSIYKYNSSN